VPYRDVNNCILDAYEWLNGSLVVPIRDFTNIDYLLLTNDQSGSPTKRFEDKLCGAFWRVSLAFWLTGGYFNILSYNCQRKTNKKALFLATFFQMRCWLLFSEE
jgi:hypothetical protein